MDACFHHGIKKNVLVFSCNSGFISHNLNKSLPLQEKSQNFEKKAELQDIRHNYERMCQL